MTISEHSEGWHTEYIKVNTDYSEISQKQHDTGSPMRDCLSNKTILVCCAEHFGTGSCM